MGRLSAADSQEDLWAEIVKLRKQRKRLQERLEVSKRLPAHYWAEGNNGGSYIEIGHARDERGARIEGMVRLEVGETCIRTVNQDISVVALAAILTYAKDKGFQAVVDEYLKTPGAGGSPLISVDHDMPPKGVET